MKIHVHLIDLPTVDLRAAINDDALDELAASMRDHGQLQPIGVRHADNNRFEVVFGARRTRAAQILLWQEIEAVIVEDRPTATAEALKLIENVQRLDMTPIEEANGLAALIGDDIINVRALQRQTGKSRDWITSRLALLDMPDDLQGAVQAGLLGIGAARALATIDNDEVREQYTLIAVQDGCTTDQATAWAAQAKWAASGIIAMDELEARNIDPTSEPQAIDQQYHCFICTTMHSWRRVNALMVCGTCQEAIATSRLSE